MDDKLEIFRNSSNVRILPFAQTVREIIEETYKYHTAVVHTVSEV